jgi:ribosome-binding factor A
MARQHQHREQSAGVSARQLRVGELIRHAFADMFSRGDVHDPVIEAHMITVPEVRMSADLRLATIYIMPLGGRDEDEVLGALERNKRYMRGEIARRVKLKFAPEIRFRVDDRFDEAERIARLLQTPAVQRDLKDD